MQPSTRNPMMASPGARSSRLDGSGILAVVASSVRWSSAKAVTVPRAKEKLRLPASPSTLPAPEGHEPSPRQVSASARNSLTVRPLNSERPPVKFVRTRSPNGTLDVPRSPALLKATLSSSAVTSPPKAPDGSVVGFRRDAVSWPGGLWKADS